MTQYEAYLDAYPTSQNWKRESVDVKACNLAKEDKIRLRRKELRDEQTAVIRAEAKWTRDNAYDTLIWLIDTAKKETAQKGEFTGPCVSAITNATKELNTIYAVTEKPEGQGVLEDILSAVRGTSNDRV